MTFTPPWLNESGLQQLFAATHAAGGEARVVGGAVRDFLLGRDGGDIDLASTLPPKRTIEMAAQQGWKAIPTGIAHGTVMLLLPERSVEVTTLRRDVATDGRHATVAFTDDWREDAARRDFTINAMSMDAQGKVYDYFGGQDDLANHRVVFIGDAATRITEDALRILRFFRFLASHGHAPADSNAVAAITALKGNIATLSGERIATEMKKLLQVKNPIFAVQQMHACGVDAMVANAEFHPDGLQKLLQLEAQHHYVSNPFLRLLSLIAPAQRPHVAAWISDRWKLSRAERDVVSDFAAAIPEPSPATIKALLRKHPRAMVMGMVLLATVDGHLEPAQTNALIALVREWNIPTFPVTAGDLIARGFVEGKALGDALRALETVWVQSDYTLDKAALLARHS